MRKVMVVVFAFILIAGLALTAYWVRGSGKKTALIYIGGELYDSVDLSRVTQSFEIYLPHNTLLAEHGQISVIHADCPSGLCIKRGAMRGGLPIICLPNQVTVIMGDIEEVDTVTW